MVATLLHTSLPGTGPPSGWSRGLTLEPLLGPQLGGHTCGAGAAGWVVPLTHQQWPPLPPTPRSPGAEARQGCGSTGPARALGPGPARVGEDSLECWNLSQTSLGPPGSSPGRLSPGTRCLSRGALHPLCPEAAKSESCPGLKKEIFINNLNNNTVVLNGHTWEAHRMVRKEAGAWLQSWGPGWGGRGCCENRAQRQGLCTPDVEKETRSRS